MDGCFIISLIAPPSPPPITRAFLGFLCVPIIQKVYEKYGDELVVIHLDAHADLREGYLGNKNSHASAIRRLMDFMPV